VAKKAAETASKDKNKTKIEDSESSHAANKTDSATEKSPKFRSKKRSRTITLDPEDED